MRRRTRPGGVVVGTGAADTAVDAAIMLARYRERLVSVLPTLVARDPTEHRVEVARRIDEWLQADGVPAGSPRDRLLLELVDDIVGYGPLEPLLADPDVTEVMVNGALRLYVERHGRLEAVAQRFRDGDHLRAVIERLLLNSGRRLDDAAPIVDARLPDGSRLNAVLPPVAVDGPLLTIRRAPTQRLQLDGLLRRGALDAPMAAFLHAGVLGRCNLLISGGAGAGKTTLLAALAALVPAEQRIVTLEDVAELMISHPHVAGQECRAQLSEDRPEVSMRHLVRNALRMRPDRLVMGEVRGAEAYDMVQAMNTGHEGSMATVHANSAVDAMGRLESMLSLAAPGLSIETLRGWLAAAIDLVIHCERDHAGGRWVTTIASVERDRQPPGVAALFERNRDGSGHHGCGRVPIGCLERMARHGVRFPPGLFRAGAVPAA
ncbi:MAG: CpaF family protein [Candidatus Dormibacteria bacterium]